MCGPKIEFGTSRTQSRKVIILSLCGLSFKQMKVVHKYLRMAIVRSEHCYHSPFINQFSPRYALFYLFHLISSPVCTYETNIQTNIHACMHTYVRTCVHTYTHTYILKYIHTYTHYIHTYTHTYIHTYIQYIHTYMHAYTHTYVHTHIHTLHTYIHTYIHTCMHTHIHIYIHTYIHTYIRGGTQNKPDWFRRALPNRSWVFPR